MKNLIYLDTKLFIAEKCERLETRDQRLQARGQRLEARSQTLRGQPLAYCTSQPIALLNHETFFVYTTAAKNLAYCEGSEKKIANQYHMFEAVCKVLHLKCFKNNYNTDMVR